jgi:hypothetical protein
MTMLEFDIQIPNIVEQHNTFFIFLHLSKTNENAHLVHLKEVTDLGTNYKWNKIWVLNKRRRGMRTSVYIWCRGKGSWSTLCCIHSSSDMLYHLGKPIYIWCWCILPTQYELHTLSGLKFPMARYDQAGVWHPNS